MQPRRKHADWAYVASPAQAAPVDEDFAPVAADLGASPALALQAQLAARLAGPATAEGSDHLEAKWPMPLRIATILTLSTGLWAGIGFIAASILTK